MAEQNKIPLSPVIDGYNNSLNSDYLTQGFVTSTPKSPSILARRTFNAKHIVNGKEI